MGTNMHSKPYEWINVRPVPVFSRDRLPPDRHQRALQQLTASLRRILEPLQEVLSGWEPIPTSLPPPLRGCRAGGSP